MTDFNAVPGTTPQPGSAQPQGAAPAGQQSYYQQGFQQAYQQGGQQTAYSATPQPGDSQVPNGPKRPGHSTAKTFGVAFAGAAVACAVALGGFGVYQAVAGSHASTGSGTSTTLGASTNTDIQAQQTDASLPEAVAQKALPSVAAIDVYTNQAASSLYGLGGSSSGDGLTETSLGSGVVLSADGYIVTNYHVVEGADALKVTVDGQEYDADVVGSDQSSDIAVVKAKDANNLTPIEIGDSDDLTIGEWVMSIGSPFGLEQSVATGIVSATSRSQVMDSSSEQDPYGQSQGSSGDVTIYPNMIQTDAAINPGNSGGALVDEDGKLIGINTLITSYSGNYSGVGFAIPVNYAVNIAQQIINGKTPTHAQLGVSLSTVNSSTAKRYGLSVDSGAYIASVESGSGAASAGIKQGDIITKFDGKDVTSASDLMLDIRSKNPGDKVSIEVNRDGQTQSMEVTLGSDENAQKQSSTHQNGSGSSSGSLFNDLFGGGSGSGSSNSGTSLQGSAA